MPFSKKNIDYVAGLARLKLSEEEKEKYAEEFSAILDFVNQLEEVDVGKVEPLYHSSGLENITRDDENPLKPEESALNLIIKQSPESEGNFLKVKTILKKDG